LNGLKWDSLISRTLINSIIFIFTRLNAYLEGYIFRLIPNMQVVLWRIFGSKKEREREREVTED
jgi:hypothetical protein